jgi:uncharacterized membrane protein YphA (DoxX/SURF4 family)
MPSLPLTPAFVYGGLSLALLALVVAALQQKWSLRVFMLCALRLAIGWHFLFEGLHKLHSVSVGPTETNKPFSSEMFHATAEGPAGPLVRRYFLDDTAKLLDDRTRPSRTVTSAEFVKLSPADQAALCPPAVAAILEQAAKDGVEGLKLEATRARDAQAKAKAETDLAKPKAATDAAKAAAVTAESDAAKADGEAEKFSAEAVVAKDEGDEAEWQAAKDKAQTARAKAREARRKAAESQTLADAADKKLADARKKVDDADRAVTVAEAKVKLTENDGLALKAQYAAWVTGPDTRDAKVKFFGSDVPQTVPERRAHIQLMRDELADLDRRQAQNLGSGYGHEMTRTKTSKADIRTAEADLIKDADAYVDELKKVAGWKPDPDAKKEMRTIDTLDTVTSWAITIIGACLLAGLFTRLNCLLAAGFLVMTVLEHPTVPWLPLPPNTEGNPLYVNKNVIEALALLAIATFPTGRWFGLDAMISYLFCGKKKKESKGSEFGPYPARA